MFRTIITATAFALSIATPALAHHDGHHGGITVTEGYARATLLGAGDMSLQSLREHSKANTRTFIAA